MKPGLHRLFSSGSIKHCKVLLQVIFLLLVTKTQAQQIVSGQVTDDTGEGLPGATVMELGTQNGTVTDIEGNYSLKLTSDNPELTVSYVGFVERQVKVNGRSLINISLDTDVESLEEVVVIGYGTEKKSDLTGAVSSITNKDFNKGIVMDPGQALQGKQAGVIVVQSNGADPNATPKVRIRGSNSINLSSEPLYVVDGFPLPEGVGLNINPNDIARMDILKDASATAIYGVRGANGVVLITTKEGREGTASFQYSNQIGFQQIIKPFEYASASALARIENEIALENGNIPPYSSEALDSIGSGTDWIDMAFRNAVFQNHNLSLSTGTKTTNSYVSLGYTTRDGVLENTNFDRVNATLTLTNKAVKKLKLYTSVKASAIRANFHNFNGTANDRSSVVSLILYTNPLIPAYNADGTYGDVPAQLGQARNPLPDILDVVKEDRKYTIYTNASAEYSFTENFTYKVNAGFSFETSRRGEFIPFNVQGGEPDAQGFGGAATVTTLQRTNALVEHLLEYKWQINATDKMTYLAGFSTQENDVERYTSSASGFATEGTTFYDLGGGNVIGTPVSQKTSWQIMSFLVRANYSLKEKYLFTASVRRDGASPFPKANRWGVFPSAAVGWKLSNEPFMAFMPDHSSLKLRVGWGQTGNFLGISEGDSQAKLGSLWSTYTYNGVDDVIGLAPLNIPNPDLQWERTDQINVGADASILNDKWTFTLDYYNKLTNNLIYQRPVSLYSGFEVQTVTDGSVRNYGVELGIVGNVQVARDLSLRVNANFSYNKNHVESLVGGADTLLANGNTGFGGQTYPYNLLIVGRPVSTFFGYKADRILQVDDPELQPDGLQPNSEPGDYLFKDLDGNGIIDENDRTVLGSGLPVYIVGLNTRLSYKALSLDIQLTGALDVDRLNMNRARGENIFWKAAENRWSVVNSDSDIARSFAWGNTRHGSFVNDIFVEDASYLRVQNLTLSYTVTDRFNIPFISELTLSATAQNMLTITGYKGFDPELSTGGSNAALGLDYNAHPQSRNYIGSLKITF
ncbi:SusC/RagA family TonB-linked outer membrane protein [Marinoscillum furvescens]|nr:TonB-dependent receptor [Marinoscillum furvescens]